MLLWLLLAVAVQQVEAWRRSTAFAPPSSTSRHRQGVYSIIIQQHKRSRNCHNNNNNNNNNNAVIVLYAGGGFGGSSGGGTTTNNNNKEKEKKLKPKQQWDRYVELKKATKVPVAARVGASDGEWLVVGSVKSKDNAYTKIAVVRQRALIAEVRTLSIVGLTFKIRPFFYRHMCARCKKRTSLSFLSSALLSSPHFLFYLKTKQTARQKTLPAQSFCQGCFGMGLQRRRCG
jgi:hypothetical protein